MDLSEGTWTAELESPGNCFKGWVKKWVVNLSCARSAFESTSVVSMAKFGVFSEKLPISNHVRMRSKRRTFTNARSVPNARCKVALSNRPLRTSSMSRMSSPLESRGRCVESLSIYCHR